MLATSLSAAVSLARACALEAVVWGEDLALAVLPQGGQGRARRNAWQAMAGDAALAAARRQRDAALALAQATDGAPAARAAAAPARPWAGGRDVRAAK